MPTNRLALGAAVCAVLAWLVATSLGVAVPVAPQAQPFANHGAVVTGTESEVPAPDRRNEGWTPRVETFEPRFAPDEAWRWVGESPPRHMLDPTGAVPSDDGVSTLDTGI